ncbi:hypothetical protein K0M31_010570 [Melipona bicolor]|uniref:Uncharacterized protein n=1 Tax=Melipona bicolor TaxID=60889 RepID=A0AA40FLA7_9HYME|nr:hypothetical protein K0M31_010570 [Melipona bicolor]
MGGIVPSLLDLVSQRTTYLLRTRTDSNNLSRGTHGGNLGSPSLGYGELRAQGGEQRRMCLVRGVSHAFGRVVLTPRMCSGELSLRRNPCSGELVLRHNPVFGGVGFTPRRGRPGSSKPKLSRTYTFDELLAIY